MAAQRLTDRDPILVAQPGLLIHVVDPTDFSQDPAGSSYYMTLQNAGGAAVNDSPVVGVTVPPGPCVIEPRVDDTVPSWITAILDTICALQASVTNLITFIGDSAPVGMIVMWSGTIATIPSDWRLCDGTVYPGVSNPDLRGKFVIGAANDSIPGINLLPPYGVGSTGGANTVTLTALQSGLNAHNHAFTEGIISTALGDHSHQVTYYRDNLPFPAIGPVTAHPAYALVDHGYPLPTSFDSNTITANLTHNHGSSVGTVAASPNVSASNAHENRPPYYALAYIIKIV